MRSRSWTAKKECNFVGHSRHLLLEEQILLRLLRLIYKTLARPMFWIIPPTDVLMLLLLYCACVHVCVGVHLQVDLDILLWIPAQAVPCALAWLAGPPCSGWHNPEDESGSRVSGETRETLQQGTNHAAPDSWLLQDGRACYNNDTKNMILIPSRNLWLQHAAAGYKSCFAR